MKLQDTKLEYENQQLLYTSNGLSAKEINKTILLKIA